MSMSYIHFFSAARKNNWESEAGWTLRSIDRKGMKYNQSSKTYIDPAEVLDITQMVDAQGNLKWNAPPGSIVFFKLIVNLAINNRQLIAFEQAI